MQIRKSVFTILFDGMIDQTSGLRDLVEVYAKFRRLYRGRSRLVLQGKANDQSLFNDLESLGFMLGLGNSLHMQGRTSDEKLSAYAESADCYISLALTTEPGPMVAALKKGIPVVALENGSLPPEVKRAGVVFTGKNLDHIAAFLSLLARNRRLAARMTRAGLEENREQRKTEVIYQFEGPFDSSYSLAMVNRETAVAMEKMHPGQVSLYPFNGREHFVPAPEFLQENSQIIELFDRSVKEGRFAVVLRNTYPPWVYDARGMINVLNNYAWEESAFPSHYMDDFNRCLDGMAVTSEYVKKVMQDNGFTKPIVVMGNGVDHVDRFQEEDIEPFTGKSFVFLHISSCFPRKGPDVMLEAYCRAFGRDDDVCLVIKTFDNPHNEIKRHIEDVRRKYENCPEIVLLNGEIGQDKVAGIYRRCHCLVMPSRGEGFGLPAAEAMRLGIPVITTAYGGQSDFCREDTAWLIDYRFERARTHMHLFDSCWVEPDVDHLAGLMREVRWCDAGTLSKKTGRAREVIGNFTWRKCAQRLDDFLLRLREQPIFTDKRMRLAWVSSWKTRCGIASYSSYMLEHLTGDFDVDILASVLQEKSVAHEEHVHRCWGGVGQEDLLELEEKIIGLKPEAVIIQFHFAFFRLDSLARLVVHLEEAGMKVLITFHAVESPDDNGKEISLSAIAQDLQKATWLFVHRIEDLNILKKIGLQDNVSVFPHGVRPWRGGVRSLPAEGIGLPDLNGKKIVGAYGFMLPHKGIYELIEAFALLVEKVDDAHLLLVNARYPGTDSRKYMERCHELAEKKGLSEQITMIHDFLPDKASCSLLSLADLVVFPYQHTKESSSAAVRMGVAVNRPLLCTPLEIFSDIEDIVHFSQGTSATDLGVAMTELLADKGLLQKHAERQRQWIEEHSWQKLAERLGNIIKGLGNNNA